MEAGFHFDYYRWDVKDSLSKEDDSDFLAYTFSMGPVFYSKKDSFGFLGEGRFLGQAALGYKVLDMALDFPVRDYDSGFGGELALGFQKDRLEFRVGYSLYFHPASAKSPDLDAGSGDKRLNLSNVFFEVTYAFGPW